MSRVDKRRRDEKAAPSTSGGKLQDMSAAPAAVFGLDPFWLSLALLLATYAILTLDRLNRAIVALVGAALMMLTGILDQDSAIAGQDFNTLALLIGMMLLVAIARPSGMFQYLAFWSAKAARGHPGYLLALLTLVTAVRLRRSGQCDDGAADRTGHPRHHQ